MMPTQLLKCPVCDQVWAASEAIAGDRCPGSGCLEGLEPLDRTQGDTLRGGAPPITLADALDRLDRLDASSYRNSYTDTDAVWSTIYEVRDALIAAIMQLQDLLA